MALTLAPASAQTPLGRLHPLTATVTDSDGQAATLSYLVSFQVAGANGTSHPVACFTAANGQCTHHFSGANPGLDTISAFVDTNQNGTHDTDEPSAQVTNTWTQPTLSVTPATAETPLGRLHPLTATVTDSDGQAATLSYLVSFQVAGANGTSHPVACFTAANGQCTHHFSGANPGLDTISAFVDTNQNGTHDTDEPSAQVTNTWVEPTPNSTPGCAAAAGTLQTNRKAGFAFAVRYRAGAATPEGAVGFTDQAAGKSLVSGRITSMTIVGTRATVRGEGRTNGGQTVAFKVEVDDRSANGRLDTFTIEWPGYSASGTLRSGNVVLTCPLR